MSRTPRGGTKSPKLETEQDVEVPSTSPSQGEMAELTSTLHTSIQQLTQRIQQLHLSTQEQLQHMHERLDQQQTQQQELVMGLLELRNTAPVSTLPIRSNADEKDKEPKTTTSTTSKKDELPKMPIKMKE